MPFKPLSERVKKHKSNKANEAQLHQAAEAHLAAKNGAGKLSFQKIEERFPGVKKSTLERYINGKGKTTLEFNATKQKLSRIEEGVLVNLILESADRDCDRLVSEGVPKKNWPKGPIRPRKPKLPATLDTVVDEDDGEDEEEDEH